MQSENCFALTLSLSPGRAEVLLPHWNEPPNGEAATAMEIGLPLRGGEGTSFFRVGRTHRMVSQLHRWKTASPLPEGEGQGEGEGNLKPIPSPVRRARLSTRRKLRFPHELRFVPPHPGPLPWGEGEPTAALGGVWRARNPPARQICSRWESAGVRIRRNQIARIEPLNRSADWQSAVSRTPLHSVTAGPRRSSERSLVGNPPDSRRYSTANALPTASRRYGRLPTCATGGSWGASVSSN